MSPLDHVVSANTANPHIAVYLKPPLATALDYNPVVVRAVRRKDCRLLADFDALPQNVMCGDTPSFFIPYHFSSLNLAVRD